MTIVYAIEQVHKLGKIDKIESNRNRASITCIITMKYWSDNCTVLELQEHLLTKNIYRLYAYDQNYLLLMNATYFNISYHPVQHIDLILIVNKNISLGTITEFMNKINIGKISHYKEITTNDTTNQCVLYDIKLKNQEKKCIRIIVNYWYDTFLGYKIQSTIKQSQLYTFKNQWKIYPEIPYFMQNNIYNYNAH